MMKKLNGLFSLIRFELPFSAGICVVLGQLFALGDFPTIILIVYGFFSVFLISASILVLNDYLDIETDMINAPHRPIPSKQVSPNEALFFLIFLLAAGILFSFLLNIFTFFIAVGLTLIGFLYNRFLKKSGLPGNLMVSISVGMTFIYGGASVNAPFNKVVMFFAVIAALIDLGEEIAADSMDIKGDLLINSNSLAIIYGKETAIKISAVIFLLVVVISFIPFILNWFGILYLIPILIMDFAIGYSTYKLLGSQNEEGRKFIRLLYLGATFGLVIFLFMRLFGV